MCTVANAEIIEEIVNEWVDSGKLFTAFDVSQEGKQRGTTEPHSHLKGAVHSLHGLMKSRSYARQIVTTPGGGAWLYHPVGVTQDRINDYVDKINGWQTQDDDDLAITSDDWQVPSPPVKQPSLTGDQCDLANKVDKDFRLPLYRDILGKINAQPGDVLEIADLDNAMEIGQNLSVEHPNAICRCYSVNNDCRIRVSKNVLERCLGKDAIHAHGAKISISVIGNRIRVELANQPATSAV